MNTTTEQNYAVEQLRKLIDEQTVIYTLTTYTRSQTDYVRLFAVTEGDIVELTFYTARAAGHGKIKPEGIPYRGGGYSKALEAADDLFRAVFGRSLDQSRWREL